VKHYAKVLGRSPLRRAIFLAMYSYTKKPRSIEEIIEQAGYDAPKQSYRNELNLLANGNVIDREEAGTKDVRTLYTRIPEVMAKKKQIIALADDPAKARKVPTSQEPRVSVNVVEKRRSQSRSTSKPKLKILYLTATPASQHSLRTDAEVATVQEQIKRANLRDQIRLELRPAADVDALMRGLNDVRPTVVHFSGHAGTSGLWMDDGKIVGSKGSSLPYRTLTQLLGATDSPPRVVILNACKTASAATSLATVSDAVVTMADSVSDLGAAIFASHFYSAIGAGQPVAVAFQQASVMMGHASPSDTGTATITYKTGVDGKKLRLI
jgi:hypothetical protein